MRWYIASRVRHINHVKDIQNVLAKYGQVTSYDWTANPSFKPYYQNSKKCQQEAKLITDALSTTDIFILLSDSAGTDMFIELGLFLGAHHKNNKIASYIVGPYNNRSLMHHHPQIQQVATVAEIMKKHLPQSELEISSIDSQIVF